MLTLEPGLYIKIVEFDKAPPPYPLQSGFNEHTAYRVLGMFNASESSEALLILSNDRDEIWFISNRHVRTVVLLPGSATFRLPLATIGAED
jgi:hypothetical protein